mmetsp:Transcript_15926/g.21063  ORF Transcript_15926/g.21063 Transcript_15926/m.21063 type:complete len:476 (+) Transcript_15926:24-1451(+)
MGINDFRVLQPLGQGSFASVFKVVRKSDEQVYAMKRVNISKMSKKEVSDTLNEIRFLASLRHHNIVAYFESFLDKNDTELCIIMEYCGMGDLAAKIERYRKRRRYIDERQVWQYLHQTADALKLLHEQGIMHRDVKAANAFLGEDGSVKLGDMNVSKRMEHGLLKTQIGTPYYMSPEIWSNRPYNAASDMWALGCMVYELCALRPPFLADSFPELRRQVQSGQFPPISRNYSYALSTVISKLLRVNPRERLSAANLLSSKEMQQNLHAQGYTPQGNSSEPMQLLETIKVPHNITRLTNQLPKACYPDKRPNSPDSWPITHRRASKAGRPGSNGSAISDVESARKAAVANAKADRDAQGHGGGRRSNNQNMLPPRFNGAPGQRLSAVKESSASPLPIPPKGSSAAALREGRQSSGKSSDSHRERMNPHAPKRYSSNTGVQSAAYHKRQQPARRSSRNNRPGGYSQHNGNQAQKWWG